MNIIHDSHQAILYEMVPAYKMHKAHNEQFPRHKNQFFQHPYKRYLDKMLWIPGRGQMFNGTRWLPQRTPPWGLGGLMGSLEVVPFRMPCNRDITITAYPGVMPVDGDFILKLQRAPIEFENFSPSQRQLPPGRPISTESLDVQHVHMFRGRNNKERPLRDPQNHDDFQLNAMEGRVSNHLYLSNYYQGQLGVKEEEPAITAELDGVKKRMQRVNRHLSQIT